MKGEAELAPLRTLMAQRKIDVYVLPRTDEHQSEYLCECDERVAFISGFTGSNAIAVISQKEALLWTDGRYFLQAEKELQEGWKMMKMMRDAVKWFEHIGTNYPEGTTIEMDGRLISAGNAKERSEFFESKKM